jgi:hypothetical protein
MKNKQEIHGCLYRLIGRCPHCTLDEGTSHHPNNFDCQSFKAIGIWTINPKPIETTEEPQKE